MNTSPVRRAPTFFLKAVVVLIGAAASALWAFSFPSVWQGAAIEWPALTRVMYPGMAGIYATIIPFLYALYQTLKLLHYIDKNNAFSESSIRALRHIKFSAIVMSMLYATALPLAFVVAQLDDAPGLVLMSIAVAGSPLIIATFAAVLQKLVQSALDMKAEHDLTV